MTPGRKPQSLRKVATGRKSLQRQGLSVAPVLHQRIDGMGERSNVIVGQLDGLFVTSYSRTLCIC